MLQVIFAWVGRWLWRKCQDYEQPRGETPAETMAKLSLHSAMSDEQLRNGSRTPESVKLMHDLRQKELRHESS